MISFSQTAGIQSSQIDRLDNLVRNIRSGDPRAIEATGPLSTGERLYVALAANRCDLLRDDGYTIAQALARLDEPWVAALIQRWQYVD